MMFEGRGVTASGHPPVRYGAGCGTATSSMSQLRLNPLTGRWVAIAANRATRPGKLVSPRVPIGPTGRALPLLPRQRGADAPRLETYGRNGEWVVRVVPNRYPAFEGDEYLQVENLGPVFTQAAASGSHEVLVFTRDHEGRGPTSTTPRWR